MHLYRVYTQVISPLLRGGIFVGDEPEGEVEIDAGVGKVEEAASEAQAYGGQGGVRHRFNIVNISIASIAYSNHVSFLVHEGQAVDSASFTSTVPIVPRA